MKTAEAETLLADLEQQADRVQLHHAELENLIASCMDEIYELSLSGKEKDRKMKLVAIEHRARLVLARFKKLGAN